MRTKKRFSLMLIIFTILVISIIATAFFMLVFTLHNVGNKKEINTEYNSSYHLLVTGTRENETFVKQIFSGASQRATAYNASVQLYIPNAIGENTSVQSLLDYATYLEPDGVIVCFDDFPGELKPPYYRDGTPIPIITTGYYYVNWPQVSFIGINYSELGSVFSSEIFRALKDEKGSVLIIDSSVNNDANYSLLMNVLMNNLDKNKDITVQSLTVEQSSTFSLEDNIRQLIASTANTDVIVSVSEIITIHAAQSIIDLNMAGKTKLIGYSEGDNSKLYFYKGILTTMISIDSEEIGRKAVNELFEYKNNGSANSYVVSDIQVKRKAK